MLAEIRVCHLAALWLHCGCQEQMHFIEAVEPVIKDAAQLLLKLEAEDGQAGHLD